jgi:hypothetical protein
MGRFDCIIMNITIPNKSYVIYVTTQTINKNKQESTSGLLERVSLHCKSENIKNQTKEMTVKTIFVLTTYYIVPRITLKFIFTGTYGKGTKLTTYYIVPRITLEFIIYWDLWEGNKIICSISVFKQNIYHSKVNCQVLYIFYCIS